MEYEDESGPTGFQSFFRGRLRLKGERILDFGCGFGGRTVRYAELGAAFVAGTEVVATMVEEARQFAALKGVQADFRHTTDTELPFAANSFDVVYSYDVFEHVRNLESTLRECLRVLRPGGTLFGLFPPFYHPNDGSHLHGFLSKSPAANLIFPSSALRIAGQRILDERNQSYTAGPLDPPDYPLWSVNGTTVRKFERIIRKLEFSRIRVQHLPLISPHRKKWQAWRMKYWAFPFELATRVPLVREACIDRICLEVTK